MHLGLTPLVSSYSPAWDTPRDANAFRPLWTRQARSALPCCVDMASHNSDLQKRKSPAIFSQGRHVILSSLPPSTIQAAYQSRLKYGVFN